MKWLDRLSSWWDDLRLGARLGAAFALVLALSVLTGVLALFALASVNRSSGELADKWMPGVGHLAHARAAILEFREYELKHARATDASYLAEYEDRMKDAEAAAVKRLDAYRSGVTEGDERALLGTFDKAWSDYLQVHRKVVSLTAAKEREDARDIADGAAKMAADEVVSALDKLSEFNFDGAEASADRSRQTYEGARWWVIGLCAGGLVVGMVASASITMRLIRQLGGEPSAATRLASAVAAGDLVTPVSVREDDADSLLARLRHMQGALAAVVSSVRQGAESVATASAEIAQGNNDLSGRTELHASALQQTTASMQELGATVTQTAQNARQADELARSASKVAGRGGQAVDQVVETMKGIHESSKKIAEIIGVIDGIAFQTNILALNAAVEAARAGAQGRGFAVVASEVRSLAQRSAQAAREIKALITASVDRVEEGTRQVDIAGATMAEVVGSIRQVTQIMNEISTATEEQSASVRQVVAAVTQMDHGTQQNAALVEQSAAAAESLNHQARQLVESVAVFRLA